MFCVISHINNPSIHISSVNWTKNACCPIISKFLRLHVTLLLLWFVVVAVVNHMICILLFSCYSFYVGLHRSKCDVKDASLLFTCMFDDDFVLPRNLPNSLMMWYVRPSRKPSCTMLYSWCVRLDVFLLFATVVLFYRRCSTLSIHLDQW